MGELADFRTYVLAHMGECRECMAAHSTNGVPPPEACKTYNVAIHPAAQKLAESHGYPELATAADTSLLELVKVLRAIDPTFSYKL